MHGRRRLIRTAGLCAFVAVLAGCTSTQTAAPPSSPTPRPPSSAPVTAQPHAPAVHVAPLRPGERWINLSMPGGSYRPQAEAGGTDDYRCILLNPKITAPAFLSGVVLQPGNPKIVHHAILYRVDPDQVAAAEAQDASDPRLGWSCFGDPGLSGDGDVISQLDSAPWVAAWATTGGEQRFAAGTGQPLAPG